MSERGRNSGTYQASRGGVVCLLAQAPEPGRVNTRLAPILGSSWASELAAAFMVDAWDTVSRLTGVHRVLVLTGCAPLPELSPEPEIWFQGDPDASDPAARVEAAFQQALAGAEWVLGLRSDAPGLPLELLEQGRRALAAGADAVLGPSQDGWYALGVRRCPDGLLRSLSFSGVGAAEELEQRLANAGLNVTRLPPWRRVDEPADLARLRAELVSGAIEAGATSKALRRSALR